MRRRLHKSVLLCLLTGMLVCAGMVPVLAEKTTEQKLSETNDTIEKLQEKSKKVTALRPGNRVRHQKFGMGTVVGFVGEGKRVQIKIQFDDDRCRVLLAIVTKLEKVADEA